MARCGGLKRPQLQLLVRKQDSGARVGQEEMAWMACGACALINRAGASDMLASIAYDIRCLPQPERAVPGTGIHPLMQAFTPNTMCHG